MGGFYTARKSSAPKRWVRFSCSSTVVGSGIMAENLADVAMSLSHLLGNTLATGAILFVLIAILAPISGAHFNPAVTFVMVLRKAIAGWRTGLLFVADAADRRV